jgi:hypothetical protein
MFIRCKHCDKKFFLGFGFGRHLKKVHGITATQRDKRAIRKRRVKFCLLPLIGIGILLRWVVIAICFPFYVLYELLTCAR